MQDDRTEHKVVVDSPSPRANTETQVAPQEAPGLFSRLYSLVSPGEKSQSPSSRETEERQQQEIGQQRSEIKRLKEELTTKKSELQERIEEIKREREDRHRERELNKLAPPEYPEHEQVRLHVDEQLEEKFNIDLLQDVSVANSEQTNDDVAIFDAAADELLESKLSTESSQQRLNEEKIVQQQQQIDELNQEILRIQTELNGCLRKEAAENERLRQVLEEERKLARESLENERQRLMAITGEKDVVTVERDAARDEANIQAQRAERNEREIERLRLMQAQTQAQLDNAQELVQSERRERMARDQAALLLQQQQEEAARAQEESDRSVKREKQSAIDKSIRNLGL